MKDRLVKWWAKGLCILGIWMIALSGVSMAQSRTSNMQSQPDFEANLFNFQGENGESSLTLYVRVKYSKLTFLKQRETFTAMYEIVASFLDSRGAMVCEKLWTDTVSTTKYAQTISKDLAREMSFNVNLPPGNYTAVIQFRDKESGRSSEQRRSISVKNFKREEPSISSIMIVRTEFDTAGRVEYSPNLSSVVALSSKEVGPQVYYEVYNAEKYETLTLKYTITQRTRREQVIDTYRRTLTPAGRQTRVLDTLSSQKIKGGDYLLTIGIEDKNQRIIDESSIVFLVRVQGASFLIQDIDKAIEQLEYIATWEEISKMREAKTHEEKVRLFNEFWKRYDPSPGTEENELQLEYYSRIEYANQNFSSYAEGWRTDMGRIFVKYGMPDVIERQPPMMNQRPYEIWEYQQHNLRLIFVDVSGFGNYRLLRPEWDSRNRIR
ncbi:MAG: GWxTD domain-containing protein [Candidatus Thermochlorobacter aerophilum]|jgi:GWxTD domain-containing protein|uniref:GWxTD domain-containing protein n=1 Tax=Candidatus Thermochlorobacter aerophilus TaxID=1868324 RepID=A0A395LZ06_9BACT|nr:MAG: GWxTD domain-containing protein [Candidatus Thermochlorobacter aerophilum]